MSQVLKAFGVPLYISCGKLVVIIIKKVSGTHMYALRAYFFKWEKVPFSWIGKLISLIYVFPAVIFLSSNVVTSTKRALFSPRKELFQSRKKALFFPFIKLARNAYMYMLLKKKCF